MVMLTAVQYPKVKVIPYFCHCCILFVVEDALHTTSVIVSGFTQEGFRFVTELRYTTKKKSCGDIIKNGILCVLCDRGGKILEKKTVERTTKNQYTLGDCSVFFFFFSSLLLNAIYRPNSVFDFMCVLYASNGYHAYHSIEYVYLLNSKKMFSFAT